MSATTPLTPVPPESHISAATADAQVSPNAETIQILVCTNERYMPGAFVAMSSALIANGGRNPFAFHVFDTGISQSSKAALKKWADDHRALIQFFNIDAGMFPPDISRDYGNGISAYARLFIGMIPAEKVLYIDSDILVMRDPAELWEHSFNGNIMLATRDLDTHDGQPNTLNNDCPFAEASEVAHHPYFNTGLILFDIASWRAEGLEGKSFELLRAKPSQLKAWDQTILNYLLRGRIGVLDPVMLKSSKWGVFTTEENLHYIAKKKPWGVIGGGFMPCWRLWQLHHKLFCKPYLKIKTSFANKRRAFAWWMIWTVFSILPPNLFIAYQARKHNFTEQQRAVLHGNLRAFRRILLFGLPRQQQEILRRQREKWITQQKA